MKKPYTEKDFAWVKWNTKQMEKEAKLSFDEKKESYKKLKEILPEKRTFENTVWALENSNEKYPDSFSRIGILGEVSPKKEIREASYKIGMEYSSKFVDLGYDRDLYISLLEYYEGNFLDEKKKLKKDDIKLLEESIRDYRRMGFDLPEAKQKELKKTLKELSKLSDTFRKNINDYEDFILCSKEELDGLSDRVISSLQIDKKTKKYRVSLAYPEFFPFMAEANNQQKRRELALKNLKRGGINNLKILEKLVSLRKKISDTLGYKDFVDYKTETRMAKNRDTAEKFQDNLLKKLLIPTKKDLKQLSDYSKNIGIKKMEHYDIPFVMTSLKKEKYEISPEAIRQYFPLSFVINQMFSVFGKLFGIKFKKKEIKLWDKDVNFYEVLNSDNSLIGYMAFDLFPRQGKFGHAMCSDIVVGHRKTFSSNEYIAPVTVVVCNFPKDTKKSPSLISLGEVETIFHEFGHALHMTLSEARHISQSGANVAWDFVETPSQIMENFVWSDKGLQTFSKHFKTGKSLPKELRDKILKSRKFQSAYGYTRQIIFGKLDLDIHTGKTKNGRQAYRQMMKQYLEVDLPEKETLFPAGFGHLVGYDAGYYSYLWALVYACDAFSEFEKKGVFDKEVGMRWRKEVLEKGSSEDEIKLIRNFLNRTPNNKAFLKEIGI